MNYRKKAMLMAGALLCLNLSIYSQSISLKMNNISVKKAMTELQTKSGYSFVYIAGDVDTNRTVSVNANELKDAVAQILKGQNVSYEIQGKNIVIKKISQTQTVVERKKKISGYVRDIHGEPIIGATVLEEGTNNGTITDFDGNYTLEISENGVLSISYIGYKTETYPVAQIKQPQLTVTLQEDTEVMDEVVVVGYGTQRKGDVTSAISGVKSDNFVQGVATDAGRLIQGKVAGLTITTPSGDPTEKSQIMLRGITTLMSSTEPLVLIDGVPGDLNTVAPEDIESIDVLKDGSAAAIYGSRGSNGVIIISTKNVRGEMPPSIEYSGYVSTSTIYKKPDFLTAEETRQLITAGETSLVDYGYETDWLKEITRTPISHVHNISLKGGTKNTNYIFSANYRSLQGVIKKSDRTGLTIRGDVTHRMFNNHLVITAGFLNSSIEEANLDHYIYRQAVIRNPTDCIYDENGNYVERPLFDYFNPVGLLNEYDMMNETRNMRWHSTINLTPIENWNIKLLLSSEKTNNNYGYSTTFKHYETTENGKNATAERSGWSEKTDYLELTTDYRFNLGEHAFTVLAGYNYEKGGYDNMRMYNFDFPSDNSSLNFPGPKRPWQ